MKKSTTCPTCDGSGTKAMHDGRYWVEEPDTPWYHVTCTTCEGKGEINELRAQVMKARGGDPPVKFRGFA